MRVGSILIAAAAAVVLVMVYVHFEQFRSTGTLVLGWGHVGKLPTEIVVLLGAGAVIIVGTMMNRATRA